MRFIAMFITAVCGYLLYKFKFTFLIYIRHVLFRIFLKEKKSICAETRILIAVART